MKELLEEMAFLLETGTFVYPTSLLTKIKAALAQPAQEPVFCEYCGGNDESPPNHCMDCARPQRTWVGLTEARAKEIWLKGKDHGDDWLDVLALARAFEAELKVLNT